MKKFALFALFICLFGSVSFADESVAPGLTHAQYQELMQLSKTYKSHLAELETSLHASSDTIRRLQEENVALTHDLSQVQTELKDELSALKKDQDQKNFWLMIGIAGAALFGVIAN